MSDNLLRIIPVVPGWVPTDANAGAAANLVREMCPEADQLAIHRYAEVTLIDQGANFESVRCPVCKAVLEIEWWQQRMSDAYATRFEVLTTVTPCCAATVSLNDLDYAWPAGFARFETQVRNPGRGWLAGSEIGRVSVALGITVRQIMSHY